MSDDRELERAAMKPDDRGARIAALERELEALRRAGDDERVQVVEKPLEPGDDDRIAALERRLDEVVGRTRSVVRADDPRPAIQVIQRTEVDTGKKKREPTAREQKAGEVMAWGCAIAMVLFMAMCFGAGAAVIP